MIIERTSKSVAVKQQLTIQEGQKVEYVILHDGEQAQFSRQFDVEKDAELKLITILLGGQQSDFDLEINLRGAGAIAKQYLLVMNNEQQITDARLATYHRVGQTTSSTVVRKVLDGQASGSLHGLIHIAPDAQLSDGELYDAVYLLSDAARNRSIPSLEINADDVKARHGSAQSKLKEEDLLYLQSRGIAYPQAKNILVDGFAARVYEQISDPDVKREVRELISHKVYA